MSKAKIVFIALIALMAFSLLAGAESLWNEGSSLYSTSKARKVGDIITIIIVEEASAEQSKSTDNKKNINLGASTSGNPNYLLNIFPQPYTGKMDNSFKDDDKTKRKGVFTATVSVQVKRILSNGVLEVEGENVVKINEELQKITVSGKVRPEDIRADNTIFSTLVSDKRVVYDGKTVYWDEEEQGFLSWLLSTLQAVLF
ncbi:MAG: flagellar basal body L-ring protein FlgH [bacterium]